MATIKAIEGRSVHQIQSGQVIVDLVSVVKELVENSLDAGASSIDVRFKHNGLDSVEVQDNGNGIAPADFESIALKHYTSKLSSFEDLDHLETFGFRGEALSSLSALSTMHITTSRAQDGAVGKKLEFEPSGRLKSTSVVAAQKGTTVYVDNLFHNLPVRRKELEKHIKREYNKVLAFLQSYACICVGIRISVSNQMPKGKKTVAFSTKGNPTTKENIANVFGAKTLAALVRVDLQLSMEPGKGPTTQSARNWSTQPSDTARSVQVEGHISKPGWGEGRQTPDRQMFFVNSRPCSLPQITKVVNEVYRSYNHHQSPFILANFIMNTTSYDVNVSPDKKTIMLHDQTALLEALKTELIALFENIDHSLPQTQLAAKALPAFRPLSAVRRVSAASSESDSSTRSLIEDWASRDTESRTRSKSKSKHKSVEQVGEHNPKMQDKVSELPADEFPQVEHDNVYEDTAWPDDADSSVLAARTATHASEGVLEVDASRRATQVVVDREPITASAPASVHPRQTDLQQVEDPEAATADAASPGVAAEQDAFAIIRDRNTASASNGTTAVSTSGSWNKRRKLNVIKRGPPVSTEITSSAVSSLTQFAAPGSQLLLNFDKAHGDEPQSQPTSQVQPDVDSLETSDGTPELHSTRQRRDSTEPHEAADDSLLAEESAKKRQEDAAVARLISAAEHGKNSYSSSSRGIFTAQSHVDRRDATYNLATRVSTSLDMLRDMSSNSNQLAASSAADLQPSDAGSPAEELLDAESKLSLTVSKIDFERMKVVGQFNLGFILATRPAATSKERDDLFIVDQHAADEKYNYERLQSTVVLQSQRLVRPIELELSAVDQEVVLNHQDALKANGFDIEVVDHDMHEASSQSFRLLTLPMINNKTFQLSDLEELLHLLSELPSGSSDIPRPRKVQRMLAMRACRSSIMVGKTLTTGQMTKVVRHMGGMDKPWNCPHGRPTMRHLFKLDGWHSWHEHDEDDDHDLDEEMKRVNEHKLWQKWLQAAA